MKKNILFNLIAGAIVAMGGLISIPAYAENNQSDVTGNNVFNNSVPATNETGSFAGNRINQQTVAQAEEISQQLRDAYRSCSAGGGCGEFNNLLQQSNTFLSNLNEQVETVGSSQSQGNRAW